MRFQMSPFERWGIDMVRGWRFQSPPRGKVACGPLRRPSKKVLTRLNWMAVGLLVPGKQLKQVSCDLYLRELSSMEAVIHAYDVFHRLPAIWKQAVRKFIV